MIVRRLTPEAEARSSRDQSSAAHAMRHCRMFKLSPFGQTALACPCRIEGRRSRAHAVGSGKVARQSRAHVGRARLVLGRAAPPAGLRRLRALLARRFTPGSRRQGGLAEDFLCGRLRGGDDLGRGRLPPRAEGGCPSTLLRTGGAIGAKRSFPPGVRRRAFSRPREKVG